MHYFIVSVEITYMENKEFINLPKVLFDKSVAVVPTTTTEVLKKVTTDMEVLEIKSVRNTKSAKFDMTCDCPIL